MRRIHLGLGLACALTASVTAATVTVETVARRGDPVPGRSAAFVFWGESFLRPPAVNDAGEIVFRARSASATDFNFGEAKGIYVKRPGLPLAVLVDTTTDSAGNPTFPVPGQPAGTRFLDFGAPLLNNAGDVVFRASFSGGEGLYAVKTTGGPIVKLADTGDAAPGGGGALFENFNNALLSSSLNGLTLAALNDAGQVAFFARFNALGTSGLYGTTVAGGPVVRLADGLETVTPTNVPGTPGAFRDVRPEISLNAAGIVAFRGSLGPAPSFRGGVFTVPVDGSSPPDTRAFRLQTAPGGTAQFGDNFTDQDINDAGVVVFRNELTNVVSFSSGLYAVDPSGTLTRIVDTLGGIAVPNRPIGSTFDSLFLGPINAAGQMAFFARIANSGIVNDQGLYVSDATGTPPSELAARDTVPPGLAPPARLIAFDDGLSAAVSDAGHMVFAATGVDEVGGPLRGLYFFDACEGTLNRIADSVTSSTVLGGSFTGPGTQKFSVYQDGPARAGGYRGLNAANDVAFLAQFSNLDFGIYVARVSVAGGGALAITCPPDVTLECPADTSPANTGEATASGCGTVTVSFADLSTPGCGDTETITRIWTASDGSANVTCNQIITVVDTMPPVLSGVPADAIVECDAVPPPATVTASDDCDAAPTVALTETTPPGCPVGSVITRTWTATDACGNTTSASQSITVQDTTPPVATAGLTLIGDGDKEGSLDFDDDEGMFVVEASCADNCDGVTGCAGGTTLSAVIQCGTQSFPVPAGQLIEIELEKENKCEIEMENGKLEVEGTNVQLIVTCTDAAGNQATAVATPVGLSPDNDDETENDD